MKKIFALISAAVFAGTLAAAEFKVNGQQVTEGESNFGVGWAYMPSTGGVLSDDCGVLLFWDTDGAEMNNRVSMDENATNAISLVIIHKRPGTLTLENVKIDTRDLDTTCAAVALFCPNGTNTIEVSGRNELLGGVGSPAIYVSPDTSLRIVPDEFTATDPVLICHGGSGAAGIGSSDGEVSGLIYDVKDFQTHSGSIEICEGVQIDAFSLQYGAAIGGGYFSTNKSVRISGGFITYQWFDYASALGAGIGATCGSIEITGGTIFHYYMPEEVLYGEEGSASVADSVVINGGSVGVDFGCKVYNAATNEVLHARFGGFAEYEKISGTLGPDPSLAYYGMTDVYADDEGVVHLWLPEGKYSEIMLGEYKYTDVVVDGSTNVYKGDLALGVFNLTTGDYYESLAVALERCGENAALLLCTNQTVATALTIKGGSAIELDLGGFDIDFAAAPALFSVAGSFTLTNSVTNAANAASGRLFTSLSHKQGKELIVMEGEEARFRLAGGTIEGGVELRRGEAELFGGKVTGAYMRTSREDLAFYGGVFYAAGADGERVRLRLGGDVAIQENHGSLEYSSQSDLVVSDSRLAVEIDDAGFAPGETARIGVDGGGTEVDCRVFAAAASSEIAAAAMANFYSNVKDYELVRAGKLLCIKSTRVEMPEAFNLDSNIVYPTVAEAVAKASKGDRIVLLSSPANPVALAGVRRSLTIDFNGFDVRSGLTLDASNFIFANSDSRRPTISSCVCTNGATFHLTGCLNLSDVQLCDPISSNQCIEVSSGALGSLVRVGFPTNDFTVGKLRSIARRAEDTAHLSPAESWIFTLTPELQSDYELVLSDGMIKAAVRNVKENAGLTIDGIDISHDRVLRELGIDYNFGGEGGVVEVTLSNGTHHVSGYATSGVWRVYAPGNAGRVLLQPVRFYGLPPASRVLSVTGVENKPANLRYEGGFVTDEEDASVYFLFLPVGAAYEDIVIDDVHYRVDTTGADGITLIDAEMLPAATIGRTHQYGQLQWAFDDAKDNDILTIHRGGLSAVWSNSYTVVTITCADGADVNSLVVNSGTTLTISNVTANITVQEGAAVTLAGAVNGSLALEGTAFVNVTGEGLAGGCDLAVTVPEMVNDDARRLVAVSAGGDALRGTDIGFRSGMAGFDVACATNANVIVLGKGIGADPFSGAAVWCPATAMLYDGVSTGIAGEGEGELVLLADILDTATCAIGKNELAIDLNGREWRWNGSTRALTVASGVLTITDSAGGGNIAGATAGAVELAGKTAMLVLDSVSLSGSSVREGSHGAGVLVSAGELVVRGATRIFDNTFYNSTTPCNIYFEHGRFMRLDGEMSPNAFFGVFADLSEGHSARIAERIDGKPVSAAEAALFLSDAPMLAMVERGDLSVFLTDAIHSEIEGVTVNGLDVAYLRGEGWRYDYESNVLSIIDEGCSVEGSSERVRMSVEGDFMVELAGLALGPEGPAIDVGRNNVTVMLAQDSYNMLTSEEKSALRVAEGGVLTIDSVSPVEADISGRGNLFASGGYWASAIGGGRGEKAGTVRIKNGLCDFTGDYYSTAIGAGARGSCEAVEILGGVTVVHTNSYAPAAVGLGDKPISPNCTVTISGGTLNGEGIVAASSSTVSGGSITLGAFNPAAQLQGNTLYRVDWKGFAPHEAVTPTNSLSVTEILGGYGNHDMFADTNGVVSLWLADGAYECRNGTNATVYAALVNGANAEMFPLTLSNTVFVASNGADGYDHTGTERDPFATVAFANLRLERESGGMVMVMDDIVTPPVLSSFDFGCSEGSVSVYGMGTNFFNAAETGVDVCQLRTIAIPDGFSLGAERPIKFGYIALTGGVARVDGSVTVGLTTIGAFSLPAGAWLEIDDSGLNDDSEITILCDFTNEIKQVAMASTAAEAAAVAHLFKPSDPASGLRAMSLGRTVVLSRDPEYRGAVRNVDTEAYYATFADALADANSGETLEFLQDIDEGGARVAFDGTLVIDMDGFRYSGGFEVGKKCELVLGDGDLVVTGGVRAVEVATGGIARLRDVAIVSDAGGEVAAVRSGAYIEFAGDIQMANAETGGAVSYLTLEAADSIGIAGALSTNSTVFVNYVRAPGEIGDVLFAEGRDYKMTLADALAFHPLDPTAEQVVFADDGHGKAYLRKGTYEFTGIYADGLKVCDGGVGRGWSCANGVITVTGDGVLLSGVAVPGYSLEIVNTSVVFEGLTITEFAGDAQTVLCRGDVTIHLVGSNTVFAADSSIDDIANQNGKVAIGPAKDEKGGVLKFVGADPLVDQLFAVGGFYAPAIGTARRGYSCGDIVVDACSLIVSGDGYRVNDAGVHGVGGTEESVCGNVECVNRGRVYDLNYPEPYPTRDRTDAGIEYVWLDQWYSGLKTDEDYNRYDPPTLAANKAYTVLDCYTADICPTNPASRFAVYIDMVQQPDGEYAHITWSPDVSNRVYKVLSSPTLAPAQWTTNDAPSAAGGKWFEVTTPNMFFKVEVSLPPQQSGN